MIACEVFEEQDYTLTNREAVASASPNVAIHLKQPPKRTERRKNFISKTLPGLLFCTRNLILFNSPYKNASLFRILPRS